MMIVAAFSSEKGEAGRENDCDLWLKIVNRVGRSETADAMAGGLRPARRFRTFAGIRKAG